MSKKDEAEKAILEIFKKVQVNIPLLEAIKQVPKYAKFLKELCTTRRQNYEKEVVKISENVSAVLQRKIPKKCKDPASFSIHCVGELIFPADFYVLEIEESSSCSMPLFLGRPFMRMAKTKIDVYSGSLTMEFDGEVVGFNIFEAIRYPLVDLPTCFSIGILVDLAHKFMEIMDEDTMASTIANGVGFTMVGATIPKEELTYSNDGAIIEHVASLEATPFVSRYVSPLSIPISTDKHLPLVIQAPTLELKQLPDHLKFAYLGDKETLPLIISSSLTPTQERKLVDMLKEHKTAIGWTLVDIKGISPTTCVHRVLLEEGAKPTREAQRRLNPAMIEVVKKKVVPKKFGIIVVKNAGNELVPQRIVTRHRVCIDYRKLNATTRKDHFPLPSIDKMLERFAGHEFYCFLDGYHGYYQIAIANEIQEKTTFTCPFGTFAYKRMPFGLCNAPGFHRRFINDFSKISRPLCRLLQKNVAFEFNEDCKKAFNTLKELLTSALIMLPPNWSLPFEITCDASDYVVGAVLDQRKEKKPHAIYYASRTLNDVQLNYSTTEKELLAVVFALEKF
ncbi:uncharacterized protein LOC112199030 [Rosa chinensis]|uniref:uncharacterized protein LOC112199030 n=1 Tax=Rosa chinensis TaxID=74649 RepID=UPI000D095494|nr:uncharacterized protein LOC112199030 [Rosa chinensis]